MLVVLSYDPQLSLYHLHPWMRVRLASVDVVRLWVLQVKVTQEVKQTHTEQLNRLQMKHQTDWDFLEDLRYICQCLTVCLAYISEMSGSTGVAPYVSLNGLILVETFSKCVTLCVSPPGLTVRRKH